MQSKKGLVYQGTLLLYVKVNSNPESESATVGG